LPEQPVARLAEARIPAIPKSAERRHMRAIDDAWEAVVREELARLRRNHQRNSRFSRPEEPA
jgi:hypothetical protein